MLNGIKHFLQIINDNWTTILVIIGLLIALWKKIESYIGKSDEEKIAIAKKHVEQAMLKMITSAETDFADWEKAGSIKRSQVIKQVFAEYPILSKVVDQEDLIAWIDEQINNSLKTLREVIKENESTKTIEPSAQ